MPFSWTHWTQNISKNRKLYPQQSQITYHSLRWDTLYIMLTRIRNYFFKKSYASWTVDFNYFKGLSVTRPTQPFLYPYIYDGDCRRYQAYSVVSNNFWWNSKGKWKFIQKSFQDIFSQKLEFIKEWVTNTPKAIVNISRYVP